MTRRAGGRSGGELHKMHKNAHIKKSLSESHELRVNSEKCHKMPRKKSNEARTNKEKPSILQHDNTGVGRMLREFMYTIRARQIGTACGLGMGIYAHEQAREYSDISDTLKEFIDTTMRGRKSDISDTLKRICEHESAREAFTVFAVPKGCGLLPRVPL